MSRSYDHHSSHHNGGTTRSSASDYLEYITRMQRMPTMIPDIPHYPNVHEVLNNNATYVEKHENHHKNVSPGMHKSFHFVEHEENTEIDKNGKGEVHEEKSIDIEADGFIAAKHKSFDLCKWGTFKA
ncbi:uncharacterized protein Fot_29594 [Forsythia ovata]|uniref:Uncharacterized protein n=1 Tax=Forsythia ovata TaxID=205694 RepID=A0ABD1TSC0_9LAMI